MCQLAVMYPRSFSCRFLLAKLPAKPMGSNINTAPSRRCSCEATRFPKHMRICSCCSSQTGITYSQLGYMACKFQDASCEDDNWNWHYYPPVEIVTCPCADFVSPLNIIMDNGYIMIYTIYRWFKMFESVRPTDPQRLACLLYKAIQVRPTHQTKKWYSNNFQHIPRSQMSNSIQQRYISIGRNM